MLQSQCYLGPCHPELQERQSSLKIPLIGVHPNSGLSSPILPAVAQTNLLEPMLELAGKIVKVGISLDMRANLQPTGFQLGAAATCRRDYHHLMEMMGVEMTTHLLVGGLAGTGIGMN